MAQNLSQELRPVPPYNLELSASVFGTRDRQLGGFANGALHQVLRTGDRLALATLRGHGDVDHPVVAVEFTSTAPLGREETERLSRFLYSTLNLGLELELFYAAAAADSVLAALTSALQGLKFARTPTLFEAMLYAVTEQQISLAAARTVQARLAKALGDSFELNGEVFYAMPTPEVIAAAAIDELQPLGLSRNKAEYLRGIARLVSSGQLDVEAIETMSETADIVAALRQIRGIGLWSAEYIAIRGLARLDVIPADDIGLQRAVAHYYFHGRKIDSTQVRELAQAWGPWRGLAAFYVMAAERVGVE